LDVEAHIEQLEQIMDEARPMPLSASVIINRGDVEDLLADLREALPDELRQARWIVKERDELLDVAAREAEQVLADAREERDRLMSETEVVRAANREAEHIVADAREQASILRLEAEDYVDSKLAGFEQVLASTLESVERGRERLRSRSGADGAEPTFAAEAADASPAAQVYDYEQLTSDTKAR
jgi:hypothetical protein